MNAVESMQSYATLAELHAQDVQKLTAAFQTLYGSLSDAQKKAADMASGRRRMPGAEGMERAKGIEPSTFRLEI